MSDQPGPRPGYNRDGWPPEPEPDEWEDPVVYNIPAIVGLTLVAVTTAAGFLLPLSIVLWRWAV